MQAHYPVSFERDMACTEAEWRMWLPGASGGRPLELGAGSARVAVGDGHLQLDWQVLVPRRIALLQLPRLGVRFAFVGVDELTRQSFMRHFDLYTQRGGG